jgi:hypothetical protein
VNHANPEATRLSFRPDDVKVLFVGESPPVGGTFFYFANSKLFRATREAFRRARPTLTDRPFLETFQCCGCYLVDLCVQPVNDLDIRDPARLKARSAGEPGLAETIRTTNPAAIVIVMKAITTHVDVAIAAAGTGAPRYELPFPARHYGLYVEELADLIPSLPLVC